MVDRARSLASTDARWLSPADFASQNALRAPCPWPGRSGCFANPSIEKMLKFQANRPTPKTKAKPKKIMTRQWAVLAPLGQPTVCGSLKAAGKAKKESTGYGLSGPSCRSVLRGAPFPPKGGARAPAVSRLRA